MPNEIKRPMPAWGQAVPQERVIPRNYAYYVNQDRADMGWDEPDGDEVERIANVIRNKLPIEEAPPALKNKPGGNMLVLREYFGMMPQAGRFGLEIEVEGEGLPENVKYFNAERDGSLRGENLEYIFKVPMNLKEASIALGYFERALNQAEAKVNMSFRTSVHVHVNVQDLTKMQLCTFLYLSHLLENALVNFCGDVRVGNRFCLRICDAMSKVDELEQIFRNNGFRPWGIEKGKYSAINIACTQTQGSVEFRSMRGTVDKAEIKTWLSILNQLFETALEFKNPREVAELYEEQGADKFARMVLGKHYKTLSYPGLEEGIRNNFSLLISLPYEPIQDF